MSDIELTQFRYQDTAVLHDRVRLDEIKALFDRALPAVAAALAAQGMHPAGPPFAKYFGAPAETVELEVGFPVQRTMTPVDGITPGTLPGGRTVRAVHVGPYDTLGQTYDDMLTWMKQQGLEPATVMWETYLSDPAAQPDPATWRTEVWWPVA
jgi:effector-binding domain-containing protein